MKLKSFKSEDIIRESWTDSKSAHTKIKSAHDELASLAKDDSSYNTALNLLLAADAYINAVDSINDISDELKKADELSDFVRDTAKLTNAVSSAYPKIIKYIDGSRPTGSIEESSSIDPK